MALLMLPQEVILHIMECLGSDYLRQDINRLFISKKWFQAAQFTMLQHLTVTSTLLRTLVAASEQGKVALDLEKHLQSMYLSFNGMNKAPLPRKRRKLSHCSIGDGLQHEENHSDEPMDDYLWTYTFNERIIRLRGILERCEKFKTLRIEAREEQPNLPRDMHNRPYLVGSALLSLLDLAALQNLTLDLHGSDVIEDVYYRERVHFCTNIRRLFSRLKSFECRMSTICPDLLSAGTSSEKLQLEVVIVNLCIGTAHSPKIPYRYPTRCNAGRQRSFGQLRNDMEMQAELLCDSMRQPRIVRVISHEAATLQHQTFDAVTKKLYEFDPSGPWSGQGKLIEDESSGVDE
ncbi:hypothetical protein VHEMI00948 [[Torrubiella] hemipterigena]|uniref:F-box domain-containing protein n=1 Tax=[Torrubiella] hemipterigena TaxID=1531966 RepID=A0A0A1SKM8_9HYPO|nr:hypothetical protein VHEMI00948 [[Torrubiella] hemipterigena]